MCGIAGIVDVHGITEHDVNRLHRMLGALAHRGPDDEYVMTGAHAAIGARRLSIIDLDTGRQPLTNEDGTVWASQNGEIYNYVELREDLTRRGHLMTTKGDTEIIAHLYEERGDDLAEPLRGMYAIAVWDERARALTLIRDRLGKKPIYWRVQNGRLEYASELKALLVDETVPRSINTEAVALYLQYQYVPAPMTIFKDVFKMPPASIMQWSGQQAKVRQYWQPFYEPKRHTSLADDVAEGTELIREAVRLRLRSDVPVGLFLSGGMDSSVVAAVAAQLSPNPVKTFSIGFDEGPYNELPYARAVAKHVGSDHVDDIVHIDAVSLMPTLVHFFDEPFGDPSAMPTYRVAELASRDVKVVLTGDGGDESFGGYTRYEYHRTLNSLSRVPGSSVMAVTADNAFRVLPVGTRLRHRAKTWRHLESMTSDEKYVQLMSIFSPDASCGLLRGIPLCDQSDYLLNVIAQGPKNRLDRIMRADLLTYLPEDLLVKMDRATMAHSIEARSPLLDHRLVEFAATLPAERKITGGQTKVVLRAIAKTLLPVELVERPKMGFGIPVHEWFLGPLGDMYTDLVLAPGAATAGMLDHAAAAKVLEEHRRGESLNGYKLWTLLVLEQWMRTWSGTQGLPS